MKRILAFLALSVVILSGCESPLKKTDSPLDTAIEMKNALENVRVFLMEKLEV